MFPKVSYGISCIANRAFFNPYFLNLLKCFETVLCLTQQGTETGSGFSPTRQDLQGAVSRELTLSLFLWCPLLLSA